MLYSRAAQYAIQAVLLLALQPEGKLLRIKEIGKELAIPGPFLAQIFHKLAKFGILHSMKGPTGGFRLAKPASDITVADIVEGVDGRLVRDGCVLGLPTCDDATPCPFHDAWVAMRGRYYDLLLDQRLSDLTERYKRKLRT